MSEKKRTYTRKPKVEEVDKDDENPVLATSKETTYNKVVLRSNINARLKLYGAVTGELYVWSKAGAEIEVDERDAKEFLAKSLGKTCCGNPPNVLLVLVQ